MRTTVVTFAGEYDLALRDELRSDFDGLADAPNVVLDFSEVAFIDSTCIAELIHLRKTRLSRGHSPETIVVRNGMTKRLFAILRLEQVFRVVETLEEALGPNGDGVFLRQAVRGHAPERRAVLARDARDARDARVAFKEPN